MADEEEGVRSPRAGGGSSDVTMCRSYSSRQTAPRDPNLGIDEGRGRGLPTGAKHGVMSEDSHVPTISAQRDATFEQLSPFVCLSRSLSVSHVNSTVWP